MFRLLFSFPFHFRKVITSDVDVILESEATFYQGICTRKQTDPKSYRERVGQSHPFSHRLPVHAHWAKAKDRRPPGPSLSLNKGASHYTASCTGEQTLSHVFADHSIFGSYHLPVSYWTQFKWSLQRSRYLLQKYWTSQLIGKPLWQSENFCSLVFPDLSKIRQWKHN